ncbi:hypothetical protein ABQE19_06930 [Enterococcus thailandicus]|uniref:hypothetical protein n=1 Tax=Enterococcus thailandicus TaxID=417368 RepID=UPI0032E40C64
MSDGMLGLIGVIISLVVSSIIAKCNQNNNKKQNDENKETQHIIQSSQKEFEVQMLARQQEFQEKLAQKQINADVILKSRLHWIDNTKEIASEFLVDVLALAATTKLSMKKMKELEIWRFIELDNENNLKKEQSDEKKNEYIALDVSTKKQIQSYLEDYYNKASEINRLNYEVNKNYTILLLNFSNNAENDLIIELINKMNSNIKKLINQSNKVQNRGEEINWDYELNLAENINSNINKDANELTKALRNYYKEEWEKVKQGK